MPRDGAQPGDDGIVIRRLVVVGASLAGLRAVQAARAAGFAGEIVLIGSEEHLPYDRPPLSKAYLLGQQTEADFYEKESVIRDELKIDLRLGVIAEGLDSDARVVKTSIGDAPYDALIVATGASPRTLAGLPAHDAIVTLRTLNDAENLRRRMRAGARVAIIGAGFIGSEIASAALSVGASPTLIEAAPVPLVRAVGEQVGAVLADLHPRNGTRMLLGVSLVACRALDEACVELQLSDGSLVTADLVVVGVGAAPATAWLEDSGIALHADGGIVCDEFLRTSLEGVYAAGDVAHWPNPLFGAQMRLENWTNAASQASRAALNAVDPDAAQPYETVPYFWSDWYGQRIQFVGTADADTVEFVSGGPGEDRFIAAYFVGERLVGAATLNEQRRIMKLRRAIAERGGRHEVDAIVEHAPAVKVGAS